MKKLSIFVLIAMIASAILAACAPASTPTPETIVQTVEVPVQVTVEVPVEKEVVVTVEVPQEPIQKKVIEFWTTDNEEERVTAYEKIAADFMAEHPEVDLRIVPIEEAGIAQRIHQLHSIWLMDLKKLKDWSTALSSTSRPSMAVGRTWLRLNSVSCLGNVPTAAFQISSP
jgi:phage pi2 protein 07